MNLTLQRGTCLFFFLLIACPIFILESSTPLSAGTPSAGLRKGSARDRMEKALPKRRALAAGKPRGLFRSSLPAWNWLVHDEPRAGIRFEIPLGWKGSRPASNRIEWSGPNLIGTQQ